MGASKFFDMNSLWPREKSSAQQLIVSYMLDQDHLLKLRPKDLSFRHQYISLVENASTFYTSAVFDILLTLQLL